jgi:putative effector of murein hydrolase LrgA (UPF0299 family)
MTALGRPSQGPERRTTGLGRLRPVASVVAVVFVAVLLWGGYGGHWSWIGINGHTATLWDWLHLLLLPLAVGVLPAWLSRRTRVGPRHKSLGFGILTVFLLLVLVGYVVPWAWTGFKGNTLWDWLELLALPLAVALTPVYRELRDIWTPRHTALALTALGAFLVLVLCGYLAHWRWTGFHGNTVWDWLHLLLLPLLWPLIVVPQISRVAMAGMEVLDDPDRGDET